MSEYAPILDLTLAKLLKKRREAANNGSVVEEHALSLLIEGYNEGIWDVYWEKGEPIFAALGSVSDLENKLINVKD